MVGLINNMIIQNPTNEIVSIQYAGVVYSVDAQSTVSVSDKVAEFWKKTHGFLILSPEMNVTTVDSFSSDANTAVVEEEVMDEVESVLKEEVVEDKSKENKPLKGKNKK